MKTKAEVETHLSKLLLELEVLKGVSDLKIVTPSLEEIIKEAIVCKEQLIIHDYLENKNSIQLH